MEQPKNTTDAKAAGAGTAALIPEGMSHLAQEATYRNTTSQKNRY
jgi:hypothetical protein